MREAALSGEIERMLQWIDVKAGDTFFVPAHTVHALGAGLAVCEIQQQSDITYRLYDYGRPRELHLEKALQVADGGPARTESLPFPVSCPYFHTELMTVTDGLTYGATDRFHILVVLSGQGSIDGQPFRQGEGWLAPAGAAQFEIQAETPASILRTWVP